jgi:hypothetical protein
MNGGSVRRLLMAGAGCMVAVIVTVASYVIPRVRMDTHPNASPDEAATAFWVSLLADLLVAAALYGAAVTAEPARVSRRVLTATAGLMAMILGLALLDAGLALSHHGSEMKGVAAALWVCAAVEFAVGLTAFLLARGRSQKDAGEAEAEDARDAGEGPVDD